MSAKTFEDLIKQGKIRYIGVSNWDAWTMMKYCARLDKDGFNSIICDEYRYNLLFRKAEDEIMPFCLSEGVGQIVYNPLAGGLLTGKYKFRTEPDERSRFSNMIGGILYQKRYWNESMFKVVNKYLNICEKRKANPIITAINWIREMKGIDCVLLGASKKEQIKSIFDNLCAENIDREMRKELDALWFDIPRTRDDMLH